MPFTVQELENLANAALDFHFEKGKVFSQTIQDKPLLREMMSRMKDFPGGKENITVRVKGEYTTKIQGYSGDDTVTYRNPGSIRTASYPYKEIHWGIECTYSELKKDGITITDSTDGTGESRHSGREMTALANIFDDKIEDMKEGGERGMNEMFWRDGTQDSDEVPGVRSFILDNPAAAGLIGGLDPSVNTWFRNRALLGMSTAVPGEQTITKTFQKEMRQLRRYGKPKHLILAGSDFITAVEAELFAKGVITQTGWAGKGGLDISMDDVRIKNVTIEYDPTLDDLGLSKYCYVLDMNVILPMVMEGENMKKHNPARPADKYVLYRAMTWTGGLVCRQRNTSGVYSIN